MYYTDRFVKERVIDAQSQLYRSVVHAYCEAEKTDVHQLNICKLLWMKKFGASFWVKIVRFIRLIMLMFVFQLWECAVSRTMLECHP